MFDLRTILYFTENRCHLEYYYYVKEHLKTIIAMQ